ncbi:MAG TPA: pitrilysin family protein, partial [Candidatus Eisenbacteria bacterium]|nr:pitrilysin family protein [Candidatus Eisenbacteria bacterium]
MTSRTVGLTLALLLGWAGVTTPVRAAEPIRRDQFADGLTVLVRQNPSVPVVAVSIMVRVGSRWETPDNAGITNLLQQVMVKGTRTRTALQIAEEAEEIGGGISASGDVDNSEVRGVALARHWRRLLELLADVTLRPTLPATEIESERRSVQSAIKSRADQPFQRAYDTMMERVYGPHAYALPVLGRGPVVARVDRAALLAHYQRFYRANRTIVSVSGDVSAREVVAEVRRLFAEMPAGEGTVPERALAPASSAGRDLINHPAAQAQVMVAFLGPGIASKDYAP